MFDFTSFARILAFAIVYAGVEYRYVNRYESEWAGGEEVYTERFLFSVVRPYHLYLLLPMFIVVSFSWPITAWAGNVFALAILEDVFYFVWRRKKVRKGEWTTRLMGSLSLGGLVLPLWWPTDAVVAVALYLAPL